MKTKRVCTSLLALLLLLTALPARADNTWRICGKLVSALKGNGYRDWWYVAGDERVEKGNPVCLAFWVMRSARENGLFISRVGWENAYVFENALYPNASGARYALTAYNADEYQNHLDFQGDGARPIPDTTGFTITASVEDRTETYTFRSNGRGGNEYYRDCWYLKKAVIESSDGALTAEAGEDDLIFSDGERRVSVPMRQYLSCFSMADFPHTFKEAEAIAALWTEVKVPCLTGIFDYAGYALPTCPVYASPAKNAARAGNGKAAVALPSGFYRYCLEDAAGTLYALSVRENDRTLIEYENDAGDWRFGWVDKKTIYSDEKGIPAQAAVTLLRDTALTDDPLHSNRALLSLKQGEQVALRAALGLHWLYVETNAKDGSPICGFIPAKAALSDAARIDESAKTTAAVKTASGSLNLHAKPFADAETLCRVPNKETVTVLEQGDEWCCVEYKENCGFVMSKYLVIQSSGRR